MDDSGAHTSGSVRSSTPMEHLSKATFRCIRMYRSHAYISFVAAALLEPARESLDERVNTRVDIAVVQLGLETGQHRASAHSQQNVEAQRAATTCSPLPSQSVPSLLSLLSHIWRVLDFFALGVLGLK